MLTSAGVFPRPRKWPLLPIIRSISSAATAVPVSISHSYEEPKEKLTANSANWRGLAATRSQAFLQNLSLTHFASTHTPQLAEPDLVKREISSLIKNKSFDNLARVLVKWTSNTADATWQSVLTHEELSYVLGKIVDHQIGLITKSGTSMLMQKNSVHTLSSMAHARELREKIRSIYCNLFYGDSLRHLYSRNRRNVTSSFHLNSQDYENLIRLELNNGKLDLASKWFQRLEHQYADGQHYKHMTQTLWLLKFKVYGGGLLSLWKVEPTELYEMEVNPRQSRLKSEKKWLDIFNEYVTYQELLLASSKVVFDVDLLSVMFASMAYSKNVPQLTKLIEQNWGILKNGQMSAKFEKPQMGDPLYPDLDTLRTIVVSMIFNKELVASMAYLNAFQEHYGIDLSKSKHFWDQLFRWSEITTRFSELRALQYFIKETATTLQKPADLADLTVTLEEAQKSADFDFEGYLKFVADLTNQRTKLIDELWKCYQQAQPGFSVRVYQTYLRLIEDNPLDENAYKYLSALALEHHRHSASADSFNQGATTDRLSKIRTLYTKGMKVVINEKGCEGKLGQLKPLIRKWSLDDSMKERLTIWTESQQPRFLEMINKRQLSNSEQAEEEDDGFLGLMS